MKKQLLNEKQVRKMMRIANIGGLSDGFIRKINENELTVPVEEEEDLYENFMTERDLDDAAADEPMDLKTDEPLPGDEDLDDGADEDMGLDDEEPLASAMTALKALKIGLEELDPEAAARIDIQTEEEPEEEAGTPDEPGTETEFGGGSEEEEEEEEDEEDFTFEGKHAGLEEANIYLYEGKQGTRGRKRQDQRKIVSEVTRRVAKRLLKLKRHAR